LNYMASITWSSFSLIFMLAYPFDGQLLSPFVVLAALPYFISMANDLKYCGYKRTDVLHIYGFNLILLPVNLAGVLKSLQQALTSKKIPFARTPKVKNRTISPLLYIIVPLLIVAFSVFTFRRDSQAHNWINAAFECFNAVTASRAIVFYIGIGNALADIWHGLTDWLYIEVPPRRSAAAADPNLELDWRAVLYHGNAEEKVPLRALHAATGLYQAVHKEQHLPDNTVSELPTREMPVAIGLQDVSLHPTREMPVAIELQDAERRQRGGGQYHG
ncbi:MAG TPA: hypothetical protein VKR06_04070, partial [Ktedonosporobacter sp.]|nr:hypothetical protein [Ktedonosporobacter sp.]